MHLKDQDKWIVNLFVLTKNRLKENFILISSNPFRTVAAMKCGFFVLPVIPFESFYRDDFQLSLLEHYILKIRHLKDMKKRLKNDFKFLVQKIEKKHPNVPQQVSKKDDNVFFESASQGSYGMKKLPKKIQ